LPRRLDGFLFDCFQELSRQKEKERLRKEYIEELKKRHEEEKNRLESLFLKEQAGRREDQVDRRAYYTHPLISTGCNSQRTVEFFSQVLRLSHRERALESV
jgi:hypothetical protein